MVTLLLGEDWIENRNTLFQLIARDVESKKERTILIVPELISHDTERRLCQLVGDKTCRFAEVLSFSRLAQRVSENVGHGLGACLDNGGRLAAMGAAARQLHGKLKTYASVETKPEFLSSLIDAVDEFKRCCIMPDDLMKAAQRSSGVFAQKLEELALLFEAYNAICEQGNKDPRDQMTWLLEQLEDSDFAQSHRFYIEGFPDFTRQHMAILEHIISNSYDVVICLNCDNISSHVPGFEKAGETAAQIIRYMKKRGVTFDLCNVPGRKDELSAVRKFLFSGDCLRQSQLDGHLYLYNAKTRHDECVAAANRILDLIEDGERFNQISVVCTDVASYKNILKMVFDRCAIPSYLSGTDDVLDKSAMVTVLSAIDVTVGGFEQVDVIRYMKSILSPVDMQACDELENYAIMWNIHGKTWQEEWTNHPGGLKEKWNDHDKAVLCELNKNRKKIIDPLVVLQRGLLDATTVKQQVNALYHFLIEIRFPERLTVLAEQMDNTGDNRNAQILNQLWEILLTALEQLYDLLGDTVWEPDAFCRLLKLLLSQYDVGTIPPVLDAVTVGSISAMRCQQSRHMIVLGAMEGALPSYCGSSGLLNDQERSALRDLGLPLTGGSLEGIQAELAEIYGVFCGAEETIMVSRSSGQPSMLYQRLFLLAGTEQSVDVTLGSARGNPNETGALLVRCSNRTTASHFDLAQEYDDIFARTQYTFGAVEQDTLKALYGDKLNLSASQVDKQAMCRLHYFLRYGLQVKERKTITVDPAEFGTFVHAVLEETAKEVMTIGGFHVTSLETTMEIAQRHAETYIVTHFGQLDSLRLSYLFRRNNQELEFVVKELWEELHSSQFVPVGFEVGFGNDGQIGAIQISGSTLAAQLRGFVDRVDVWTDGSRKYFRVIDYKTGKKDFDYCDVFNGIGLQMLLYLFALEDAGDVLLGDHAMAAGVQYFPARAPYILVDGVHDQASIIENRVKAWKRKGLLLSDRDVLLAMDPDPCSVRMCYSERKDGTLTGDIADSTHFRMLRAYIFTILGKIVDEIASGNVEPNPYTRGSADNACRFCPYGAICHPENVEGRRNYKTITAQRFWEDIEKVVDTNG